MATTANHVLLQRITVTAPVSSVTFNSIPQTGYTDLKIVISARDSYPLVGPSFMLTVNGGTASLSSKYVQGNGTTVISGNLVSSAIGGLTPGANATANTFGNIELYFPGYNVTTRYKSYSGDSVTEHNATEAYSNLIAGAFSSNSAITSIGFTASTAFVTGSSFAIYGIANVNTTPTAAPKADGGDIIKTDGTYWYHAFLSTGSFRPQLNLTADVLVVAGGGGGGNGGSGGGGAGGLLGFTSQALTSATDYVCTVGAGGAIGVVGGDSRFSALTLVKGGGRGGDPTNRTGGDGGSGGGAQGGFGNYAGGSPTSGQGYAGGAGTSAAAGSGGGAGAVGATGGAGGIGLSTYSSWGSATGTGQNSSGTYYYAGGGGGGGNAGGIGGGGSGTTAGTAGTGGGGGGANGSSTGGSGVVIIRYPVA